MHQQDGKAHRNTIPDIDIAIIWLIQKREDDRKEYTHHQDIKDKFIGGAYSSTGRAGE